jgi:hypothetical protein
MKPTLFLSLLLLLSACVSHKPGSSSINEDWVSAPILQGSTDRLLIRVPPTSPLLPRKDSPAHALLLGKLAPISQLELKGQRIMMTSISMQMAVAPESGHLAIPEAQIGKWALVRGHWAGALYQAELICVFGDEPGKEELAAYRQGTRDILEDCR